MATVVGYAVVSVLALTLVWVAVSEAIDRRRHEREMARLRAESRAIAFRVLGR